MAFLDQVRTKLADIIRPRPSGEGQAMDQLYNNPDGRNVRPRTWYQIVSAASGKLLGYSYVCADMREYQLVHPNEWVRDYDCPQCRDRFNLYKFAQIIDAEGKFKVPASEIEGILSKLPVRPRLDGSRTPTVIDTWSEGGDGSIGWEGAPPQSEMKGGWR